MMYVAMNVIKEHCSERVLMEIKNNPDYLLAFAPVKPAK